MSQIVNPHDRFFKKAMSNKRVAQEFFDFHLPEPLKQALDKDSLKLYQESYVDSELKLAFSDILYTASFQGQTGYLYVLVEHQSSPDKLMPFRMLKYICAIMDKHLKQTGKSELPLVYPIVFHHASTPYHYSNDIKDLIAAPKALIESYWLKPFQLIDVGQISDEALKQRYWSGLMEFTLKHIFERDVLNCIIELTDILKAVDKAGDGDYITALFNYLLAAGETVKQEEVVKTLVSSLSGPTGDKIMTLAEQLIAKGKSEGYLVGMAEGKAEGEAAILVRQLKRKFGVIPEQYLQHIHEADAETLLEWGERLLDATTIRDIFQ